MHAVLQFVRKYDGPHNLLVIYYTGHASYHEKEGFLELHAYVRLDHVDLVAC